MHDDPELRRPWVSPADLKTGLKNMVRTFNRGMSGMIPLELELEDVERYRQLVELFAKQQRSRQL